MIDWARIAWETNKHPFMAGVERSAERVSNTQEFFTPTKLVIEMLKGIPIESLAPGKTILDPTCGDGQLLIPVKWVKVLHFGMTEKEAVQDLYGVDMMRDNVDLCLQRLGGGNIIMGDTLNPDRRLGDQTEEEHQKMKDWFMGSNLLTMMESDHV
jgi:N-6 DNA Methylase